MEEMYKKSLQMINELEIKSEKQYNKLLKENLILSSVSLKYIAQTGNFNKIIEIAKQHS